MKQRVLLAAGVAAILVAACGGGGGGPEHMQAGQWEMKAKLTALDAPGAPPQALAAMRAQMGQEQTNRNCITPEQASNPLGQFREMMTRGQPGASCSTQEETFRAGVIRLRLTCRSTAGQPGQVTMNMDGTFTDTTLQATMTVDAQGPGTGGAPQSLRMTSEVRGTRVGECQGAPAPARPGNTL